MNECACSKKRIRESVFEICSTLLRVGVFCFAFCIWPWPVFFFPLCPELIMANFYGLMLFFMHFGLVRLRKKFTLKILVKQCYHDFSIHWNSFQVKGQSLSSSPSFTPIVSATCRAGMMTVKVETQDNFLGVVQSRDYRKPECSGYGENTRITYLRINMLAQTEEKEYCGVFISQVCNFIFDINLAKSIMVIG